jgi:hypothetical protein
MPARTAAKVFEILVNMAALLFRTAPYSDTASSIPDLEPAM